MHERIDLAAVQEKLKDAKGKTGGASNLIRPDLFRAPFEKPLLRDQAQAESTLEKVIYKT